MALFVLAVLGVVVAADIVVTYLLPALLVITTVVAVVCMVITSVRRTLALATGHSAADAALAVTAGALWTTRGPRRWATYRALGLDSTPGLPDPGATVKIDPAAVVAAVGVPSPERAAAILAELPAPLLDRVRDPDAVVPLVFGLLLSADPTVREVQLAALGDWEAEELTGLHPMLRGPSPSGPGRWPRPVPRSPHRCPCWPVLDGLDGRDKEAVVAGMVSVLGHDGVLAVPEIELLRTVCAMLRCRWRGRGGSRRM